LVIPQLPQYSTLLGANGAVLARFNSENRVPVPLSGVAPIVVKALISSEDRTFFANNGVDPRTQMVLKWSTDKAQVNLTLTRTLSSTSSDLLVLVNDTSLSTSAITDTVATSAGTAVWQVSLAPDTTSTASNAVLVSFSYLYTPADAAAATITVVGTGTAADTGGTLTSLTATGTSSSEAEELFDRGGSLTQARNKQPGQPFEGGALHPHEQAADPHRRQTPADVPILFVERRQYAFDKHVKGALAFDTRSQAVGRVFRFQGGEAAAYVVGQGALPERPVVLIEHSQ